MLLQQERIHVQLRVLLQVQMQLQRQVPVRSSKREFTCRHTCSYVRDSTQVPSSAGDEEGQLRVAGLALESAPEDCDAVGVRGHRNAPHALANEVRLPLRRCGN
jgi:hypothetical protein